MRCGMAVTWHDVVLLSGITWRKVRFDRPHHGRRHFPFGTVRMSRLASQYSAKAAIWHKTMLAPVGVA